ncbi:MAG: DNA double-strand break repair nuclease NurA [Bacteroidota bacterium]
MPLAFKKDENSLIIVDGPLSRHDTGIVAIGYIKTHQRSYLPETQQRTLLELKTHQRTPIFQIIDGWNRYSWYLRLPGPISHPLSGVVRLEAIGQLDYVVKLANTSSALLRHYASVPHKDPRAPQNLFPIGGLEKELKHRLGDTRIIQRALEIATTSIPGGKFLRTS